LADENTLPAPAAGGTDTPAPAPTPAPAGDEPELVDPADEAAPEGQEETAEAKEQKRLSGSQKLKRKLERAEAELEEYRAKAAMQPAPRPKTLDERIGPPPNPAHFQGNPNGYWAAMAGYEARKGVVEQSVQQEQREAEAREAVRRETLTEAYESKKDDARARIPDYDTVVNAKPLRVSNEVSDLLIESDLTAELEYHLAKNPQKLAQLNKMTERQAAKEIGRLESLLSGPAQNRSTQAPAPIAPLRGGAAGPVKTLSDLATGEDATAYIAARRAARAKRA
jgi:hypothetical protein